MEQWQCPQNSVGNSISNLTAPQKQLPVTIDEVMGHLHSADIHRMTGLMRPSFPQAGISCKTEPWQMASAIRQSGDVCALCAGNVDFTFIKA
jgi:hypothetical protein